MKTLTDRVVTMVGQKGKELSCKFWVTGTSKRWRLEFRFTMGLWWEYWDATSEKEVGKKRSGP